MNGIQNINLDSQTLEQCLKAISNFGSTTYNNICNGQSYSIPWGSLDWFGMILVTVFGLIFTIWLIIMMSDF